MPLIIVEVVIGSFEYFLGLVNPIRLKIGEVQRGKPAEWGAYLETAGQVTGLWDSKTSGQRLTL